MKMKGRAFLIKKFPSKFTDGMDKFSKIKKIYDKMNRNIALYKMSPPLVWNGERINYVVVSAVHVQVKIAKNTTHEIAETMVFKSNKQGDVGFDDEITTRHGALPHASVLLELGYELDTTVLKPETDKHFGDILREL